MTLKLLWFIPVAVLLLFQYGEWTWRAYKAFKDKDNQLTSPDVWEDWILCHAMIIVGGCTLAGIISLLI